MKFILPCILAAGTTLAGSAFAAEKCDVPMAEWQPREALQSKLETDGWKVRTIKTEDGCYEAYAIDG
ncbi:MAG: PepSY domain-containing protein, partial [Rhizobiaceae bacterium]|nr:PepSY domain-containing protein [Rhizobiaceae bacterium]